MSDMFTDTTRKELQNLSMAVRSAINPTADRVKRAREATRAAVSIKILDKLVGQFYAEVGPDLREEVLLDRGTIENALSRLAENLVDTARSGSLLGDGTSASTYLELVRNWYHQAQARSYEDETHFV